MAGCLLKESLTRSRGSHEDHKAERRPGNGEFVETSVPVGAWFGGKRKVAAEVWRRFGDVPNYVEPFFGSGAVLFCRPHWPWTGHRIETVNDADCFLANFWRAVKADPEAVAKWADWPVNEIDLHARHRWLVNVGKGHVEACREDPEFFDAKIAGWWVWGACCWIGSGWCAPSQRSRKQIPRLGNQGQGVNRSTNHGINEYLSGIAERLKRVRVCCGDWSRVCTETVTENLGLTGVFLDPPYEGFEDLYSSKPGAISGDVREWAIANGDNPLLRIALCGYEGEHDMPASWSVHAWKAAGGYANTAETIANGYRERIWFSPHCLRQEDDHPLFADDDDDDEDDHETEDQL